MRKRTIWLLVGVIAASYFVHIYANPIGSIFDTFNVYNEAAGQLARARTAQTPQEVIEHVVAAKRLLPHSGSVSWWSAEKGDFETMQAELDEIISRAENIYSLEPSDELYNSEMLSIHAEIETIQETLITF